MKRFNKEITVAVQVDTIADMLLSTMAPDAKHRELITEAIVGRFISEDQDGLGFLYNSLHGHACNIDFQEGDWVVPQGLRVYGYWTEESKLKSDTVYGDIQKAKVVAINPYSDKKLTIEYEIPTKKGMETRIDTISHLKCSRIPAQVPIQDDTFGGPRVADPAL